MLIRELQRHVGQQEFWVHEKRLAHLLNFRNSLHTSSHLQLSAAIQCLQEDLSCPLDLSIESNSASIFYLHYGSREAFTNIGLVNQNQMRSPRWFCCTNKEIRMFARPKDQLKVVKFIKESNGYGDWIAGDDTEDALNFEKESVVQIVEKFKQFGINDPTSMTRQDRHAQAELLRRLVHASNMGTGDSLLITSTKVMAVTTVAAAVAVAAAVTNVTAVTAVATPQRGSDQLTHSNSSSSSSSSSSSTASDHTSTVRRGVNLRSGNDSSSSSDETFGWTYVTNLVGDSLDLFALTEYVLDIWLRTLEKDEHVSATMIEAEIREHFRSFKWSPNIMQRLHKILHFIDGKRINFKKLTQQFLARIQNARRQRDDLNGRFHPRLDQSVIEWLENMERLQKGETLPARNYDRFGNLKTEAVSFLRDFSIDIGISDTKLPLALNYTELWHLGTTKSRTPTRRTFGPHFARLDYFDTMNFNTKWNKHFGSTTNNFGAVHCHYLTTDDSKHGHHKQKVIVRTGFDKEHGPYMHMVATGQIHGEGSGSAAQQNFDEITRELLAVVPSSLVPTGDGVDLSDEGNRAAAESDGGSGGAGSAAQLGSVALAGGGSGGSSTTTTTNSRRLHQGPSLGLNSQQMTFALTFGGGTTDNASNATEEMKKTFTLILEQLPIGLRGMYNENNLGVQVRRPVICGDFFHIWNLVTMWSSLGAWGETERGDMRQIHYRQVLQSFFDIFKVEGNLVQATFDERLPPGVTHKLRAQRERQQRWNVNQQSSAWWEELLKISDREFPEMPAIIITMQLLHAKLPSGWKRTVVSEVATIANDPRIRIAMAMERKNGEFMRKIMDYHKRPEGTDTTAGFRSRSIHEHYQSCHDWWNNAKTSPLRHYKVANELIEKLSKETERKQYRERLQSGADAGYNELIKMSKRLFTAPLIFLLLRHPVNGPPLLRALRFISIEFIQSLPTRTIGQDKKLAAFQEDGWGEMEELSNVEKEYRVLLSSDVSEALHYFSQFGLMRAYIRKEVKMLSSMHSGTRSYLTTSSFKETYPGVEEHLDAVFRCMPTSSLICEQSHGMMRYQMSHAHGSDRQALVHRCRNNVLHLSRSIVRAKVTARLLLALQQKQANKRARKRARGNGDGRGGGGEGESSSSSSGSSSSTSSTTTTPIHRIYVKVKLYEKAGDNKQHQQLSLERSKMYSSENMVGVPNVSTFKSKGSTTRTRQVLVYKTEAMERAAELNTRHILTQEEWAEERTKLVLPQDTSWLPLTEQNELNDLIRCTIQETWKCHKPASLQHLLLNGALPFLVVADDVTTKGDRMKAIKTHMNVIKFFAKIGKKTGTPPTTAHLSALETHLTTLMIDDESSTLEILRACIKNVDSILEAIRTRDEGKGAKVLRSATERMLNASMLLDQDERVEVEVIVESDDEEDDEDADNDVVDQEGAGVNHGTGSDVGGDGSDNQDAEESMHSRRIKRRRTTTTSEVASND